MTRYWLAKQEPDGPRGYPISQLEADKVTVWDGIHNNLALIHLREVKPGDMILYYHTGKERQAVGIMKAISGPYPNPEEDNPRFVVVDVEYQNTFAKPVTLARMKQEESFQDWELIRMGRLSFMPVPTGIWGKILDMSN